MGVPQFRAHRHVLIAISLALASVLSACGGDDGDATVGTVPPVSVTSSTTAAAAAGVDDAATTTVTVPRAVVETTTTTEPSFEGPPEFDSNSSVSTVGIDAVTFGMTVFRAENAIGGKLVPIAGTDATCHVVRPGGGPNGVLLTVTAGTVERVDITTPDITTRSGAGVGMSEEGLASLFGDSLTTEASATGGNRVIFTPSDAADAQFRVIFETDGSTVTSFRSGRLPQVDPVTPCA